MNERHSLNSPASVLIECCLNVVDEDDDDDYGGYGDLVDFLPLH